MGGRFFPLDEALELLPGQLTPRLQEQVVRLGSWLPFQPAAQLFEAFTGVAISAATVRRLTETAGRMQVEQQEAAVVAMEAGQMVVPESVPQKMVYAVDGAMVPLVGGEWAEVRTLAIGEAGVQERAEGDSEAMTQHLSYFSRLLDADSFARAALVETERRGLHQAQQAAAVGDGAEWVQSFSDYHRPDAVRILDFPHAAERFTTIVQACQERGVELGQDWAAQQRECLKDEGGTAVLATLRQLQETSPHIGLDEPLAYLSKREAMLQYPQFQAEGWPIASGMVESANKLVVEARLKGAGMHWHRDQVNPMLALRNVVCNDRWDESWSTLTAALRQRRQKHATTRRDEESPADPLRVQRFFKEMQALYRDWEAQQRAAEKANPKKPWKPPPDHPWRRDWPKPRRSAKK